MKYGLPREGRIVWVSSRHGSRYQFQLSYRGVGWLATQRVDDKVLQPDQSRMEDGLMKHSCVKRGGRYVQVTLLDWLLLGLTALLLEIQSSKLGCEVIVALLGLLALLLFLDAQVWFHISAAVSIREGVA